MRKYMLIGLGSLFLALGAVGIALPMLPTTPFVLLASGCYAYSSPTLYKKLANAKYFGEFITNYKTKAGITRNAKISALAFLYCTLGISLIFTRTLYARLALMAVAVIVTIHILLIKTK